MTLPEPVGGSVQFGTGVQTSTRVDTRTLYLQSVVYCTFLILPSLQILGEQWTNFFFFIFLQCLEHKHESHWANKRKECVA